MGDTIYVSGDYVKGDKVMGDKYVGRAAGSAEDERLKNVLETLMKEEDENGKALFCTQTQWYAVYRILVDYYGWRDNALAEFCRRINKLGIRFEIPCKLDGIKKVNQTAPFYKDFSEWEPEGIEIAYNRQANVARKFKELMEEIED